MFLLDLVVVVVLLLGRSVTLFTKKSWRPASQLEAAMVACMTLARHADEVQSMQKWQSPHQLYKEEWHNTISCKHGQAGTYRNTVESEA